MLFAEYLEAVDAAEAVIERCPEDIADELRNPTEVEPDCCNLGYADSAEEEEVAHVDAVEPGHYEVHPCYS